MYPLKECIIIHFQLRKIKVNKTFLSLKFNTKHYKYYLIHIYYPKDVYLNFQLLITFLYLLKIYNSISINLAHYLTVDALAKNIHLHIYRNNSFLKTLVIHKLCTTINCNRRFRMNYNGRKFNDCAFLWCLNIRRI